MKSSPSRRPSFLSGVSVLTLSALVVKVIGLFYRIPMLDQLGTEGMGYFNTAYELYALFCVISTAGLPVAMSVLISGLEAEGRGHEVGRVFRISLGLFALLGGGGCALLWGLSKPFATLLGNPAAAASMGAIAPTVLFICLSSAFRGYFQGRRQMLPTAISQVMEAAGKLFLGLTLAAYARSVGKDLPTTAAYAVLGLTLGTGCSVIYLWAHKTVSSKRETVIAPLTPQEKPRSVLRPLLATAIPVTASAGIISLTKCVDLAQILRRLQDLGHTAAYASSMYGCYSTLAVPLFNILPSLTTSVAMSAVPALSAALKRGKEGENELKRTAMTSLGLTLAIAIPAALGLSVFSRDILFLLFPHQPEAVEMASPWLSCLGLSVPAACLLTVTGAMLQAAGKANRPMISMLAGVAVKTVLAYVLLGVDGWGMAAIPFSSLVCDGVALTVNFIFVFRHAPAMLPDAKGAAFLAGVPTLFATVAVSSVKIARRLLNGETITSVHTLITVMAVAGLYALGWLTVYLLRKRLPIYKNEGNRDGQAVSSQDVKKGKDHETTHERTA
jgi:stage V sporulation protein B